MDQKAFLSLLMSAHKHKVSDIHLSSGQAPAFRKEGGLIDVTMPALKEEDLLSIAKMVIKDKKALEKLHTLKDFDGSFGVNGLGRFRFNIFRHRKSLGIVLRLIPEKIPSISELGLPKVLKRISLLERGLVLVTGATGSGKSSTLAAMINHINEHKPVHVITIEDPIEFIHKKKKARITQREVGQDTESFATALRAALRQDPDIVLIGEMRDAETINVALKAAETGHLVFSTVHTTDAAKTVGRLVSIFPSEEQHVVRLRLAEALQATISQRLLLKSDGKSRVPVQEIMVVNTAISDCISDPSKTASIPEFIAKGRETMGSQTFDQHLVELYSKKIITLETAKEGSNNPEDFERNLMYGSDGTSAGADTGGMHAEDMDQSDLDTSSLVMDKIPGNDDEDAA